MKNNASSCTAANCTPSTRRSLPRIYTGSIALAVLALTPAVSYGASQTWVASPVDSTWVNGLNWSGGAAPGSIDAAGTANTADIATFNTPLSGLIGGVSDPIVIDLNRNIRGLTFDTAAVGPYVIGSLAGNRLSLTSTGTIQLTSTVESPITFNAPLRTKVPNSTNASYTFLNNATSTAATLTFAGPFDAGTANTRPVTLNLDGSNTGDNLISGVISNTILQDAGALAIVKNGTGKWIISGTNNITAETDVGVTSGGTVNNGTLVVQNASAFGAAGNQAIVNGGVLQIDNLTLNNNNINLNATGEVRMNGTGTANGIIVGASATPTISTTSVTDVFTIGVGGNRLTGGSGATLNVAGPGTVALAFSSNYAGGWSFNGSGVTRLDSFGALGTATTNVAFGPGSTAMLQLNGNDTTIGGLGTNAAPGAIVENGLANTNTLTVNNAAANSFGGLLRDGAAGTLALTKGGAGTLTLTGSNNYSGGTTVNAGTLLANNVTGSATGSGAVTVNGTATLGGTGSISGAVTVVSAATLSPGAGVGTLTLGALTLDTGSLLNYEFASLASYDRTAVAGTLTLGTGITVNVNSATIEGTYEILTSSDLLGTTTGWSVTNGVAGYGYAFSTVGDNVRLTITLSGIVTTWAATGGGSWGDNANWTSTVPNAAGATAQFLGAITADSTVTLDGNRTVGSIVFNNANRYTIAQGSGGSLIMNNNGSPAQIDVTTGSHTISAPVSLADNFRVNSAAGTALTISGSITESGAPKTLTKLGAGELILPATNGFTGGIHLDGGTVEFGSLDSLGAAGDIGFTGGTLRYGTGNTADISARLVTFGVGGATINTNGNDVTFVNSVGNSGLGGLTKAGAGTLTLAQFNTYLGSTAITGGTLSVTSNDSLGDGFTGAGVTLNGGTLRTTLTMALDNFGSSARPVTIGAAGGTLEVDAFTTLTVPGTITGSASLTKSGLGVLALTANNNLSFSSPITIEDGEITLGGGAANLQQAISSGPITFRGGTLTMNGHGGSTTPNYGILANALDVPAGETGTLRVTQRGAVTGTLTGAGTLNLVVNYVRGDLNANWSAFTGQINVTSAGVNGDDFRLAAALNIPSARLNLGDAVIMYQTFNPPVNGETVHNIGELSGTAGSFIRGNPVVGRFTNWTVGALNTDSTFAGTIISDLGQPRLTKVGTGTLTLSGSNTHFGRTLVSDGTLALANVNALQNSTLDTGVFGPQQVTFTVAGTNTYNLGGLQGGDDLDMGANSLSIGVNNENTAFSGILTGSGALIKVGTGILALSGANTYTGGTTVSSGMLTYQNVNAKPVTGTTTVAAAGSLGLGVGGAGFFSSADVDSLYANTLAGVSTNPASGVGIDTTAGDFTYGTNISGIRSLTKSGTNTLTLTGANTYTGLTIVNQGTLIAPTDSALGSSSAATAGLLLNPTAGTATVRFTSVTPAIASLASTGTGTSSVILGDGVAGTPTTLTVGAGGTSTTFAGSISDNSLTNLAAIGSLTKVGPGTLALSGANTYTGSTQVSAGTLQFVTRTALYNAVTTNWTATKFAVDAGAALAVNVGGAGQFTATDLDQLLAVGTATGGFKSGSFAGIDTTAASFTYASVIANPNGGANALGIAKLGANVLTLTATNTYTGGTRINGGTLALESVGALGTTGAISFGGGTLRYSASNTTDYSSRFSTAAGQAYSIDTNFQPITLASGLTSVGGSLTKLGEGTLTLAGANTYNGPTTVSAGTLQADSTTAFGNNSAVTLADVFGVTLDLNGNNVSIGSLAGGGFLGGNVTLGGGTLTTGGDGTSTIFAGMISGAGGLTKVGTGTQTLSGFNTYEGTTTVSAGKLVLAQSFSTTAGIVIADGAVLELAAAAPAAAEELAALGAHELGLDAPDLAGNSPFDPAAGSDYAASGVAAVPEPNAFALLAFGALGVLRRRRRS